MATEEVIVLRSETVSANYPIDAGGAGPNIFSNGGTAARTDLRVHREAYDTRDLPDLRRENDVVAVARSMPLRLIKQFEEQELSEAETSAATTWGVEAVDARTSSFDGTGVKVAVLDTGIDPDHPAFSGVTIEQKNFTSDPNPDDSHGHGTHCAGTIFGRSVNGLRIGVAPGVTDVLIAKVLGSGGGSTADLTDAIDWAFDNGAHVVSMSLGIDFPGYVDGLVQQGWPIVAASSVALEAYRDTVALFEAIGDFHLAAGQFQTSCLMIGAGGNESDHPNYEVAVAPPAAGRGVMSVAALGRGDASGYSIASFSNTRCDLSGPGVDVISARPGGGLVKMSGTSMATPHVAGVTALHAQRQLNMDGRVITPMLRAKVLATATRAGLQPNLTRDMVGQGMVKAPQ